MDSQETIRNSREARRSPISRRSPPRRSPSRRRSPVRRSPPRRSPSRDDQPPPRKRHRTPSPQRPPPQAAPATPPLLPLPPLLSPTLPQAIEDALALLEQNNRSRGGTREDGYDSSIALSSRKRQRAPSDTERPGRKTVAPGKKLPGSSTNTPSSRSPRNNPSPTKSAAPSNKTIRTSLGGNTTPKTVASKTVQKRPASPKPSSPLPRSSKTSSKFPPTSVSAAAGPEKKSLIVRLKFSKRRAKDVATLLLLKPSPKRQRQDDHLLPAPAAKRQAVASGRSPAFKSPALKVPKEKDITTTPPKKVNGHPTTTALKRTASEGHAQTPSKDERNGGAPRKPLDHSIQSRVENFRAEYQRYIKKIPRHASIRYPIFLRAFGVNVF